MVHPRAMKFMKRSCAHYNIAPNQLCPLSEFILLNQVKLTNSHLYYPTELAYHVTSQKLRCRVRARNANLELGRHEIEIDVLSEWPANTFK